MKKGVKGFQKGQVPWNKNKKLSEKHKKNLRKNHSGMKGKYHTKETKKKLSDGRTGSDNPNFRGGENEYVCKMCGKEFSRYSCDGHIYCSVECSNSCLYRKKKLIESHTGQSGILAGNWKGGITSLAMIIRNHFKYRQWRSDNFTRDDFTCQNCGERGGKLHAHHIKKFSVIMEEYKIKTLEEALDCEELWNVNNGMTLCKKCHNKIHKTKKKNE